MAPISGATSAAYTTPVLTGNDNGDQFTVVVSNPAGSVTSTAAKLTVSAAPPVITTQPANISVHIGTPAVFSVVATGTAPLSYQWLRNGSTIQDAIQASYTLASPRLSDSGASFTVVIGNSAGSVTSAAATLTVTPVPVTITTQPSGGTFFSGESTRFACKRGANETHQFPRFNSKAPRMSDKRISNRKELRTGVQVL